MQETQLASQARKNGAPKKLPQKNAARKNPTSAPADPIIQAVAPRDEGILGLPIQGSCDKKESGTFCEELALRVLRTKGTRHLFIAHCQGAAAMGGHARFSREAGRHAAGNLASHRRARSFTGRT